jgi:hypothetical protein
MARAAFSLATSSATVPTSTTLFLGGGSSTDSIEIWGVTSTLSASGVVVVIDFFLPASRFFRDTYLRMRLHFLVLEQSGVWIMETIQTCETVRKNKIVGPAKLHMYGRFKM